MASLVVSAAPFSSAMASRLGMGGSGLRFSLIAAPDKGYAATLSLKAILSDQHAFVAGLGDRLNLFAHGAGIDMERVEILHARPTDPSILSDLSVRHEQAVREEATRVRVETAERLKQQGIVSATRIAQEEAKGRSDKEAFEAQAALALEQERGKLLEARAAVQRKQMESDQDQRLATLEVQRIVAAREEAVGRERQLAAEASALQLLQARLQREESELAAKLDRTRREAVAQGEVVKSMISAEEQKSQAVRDYELAKLVAEKVGDAVRALPLREARWVSIGEESPISSLTGMIAGARELIAPSSASEAGST